MGRFFNGRIKTIDFNYIVKEYLKYKYMILFFIGIIAGSLCMNIFCEYFYDKLGIYSTYFLENFKGISVDTSNLLAYTFKDLLKEVAITLLLSFMSFGGIYLKLYCTYKGITIGLLISASVLKYGFGGVLIYILSVFPHYITYGALIVVLIRSGEFIFEKMKNLRRNRMMGTGIGESIGVISRDIIFKRDSLIMLAVIMGLIVMTAFLQVYVNTGVLNKFM